MGFFNRIFNLGEDVPKRGEVLAPRPASPAPSPSLFMQKRKRVTTWSDTPAKKSTRKRRRQMSANSKRVNRGGKAKRIR